MIILKVVTIALLVLVGLFIIAYFVQPALLTFPYSAFISIFVKNPPFVDVEEHFPQHKLLKKNWHAIREELEEVLKNESNVPKFHEVDGIQRFISARDKVPWRTFVIKGYGKWVESNAAKVPHTTALLKEMPQITSAMFSILDGGKHIPQHFGFFKGVLRYHLGLVVPTDAPCYIIVGGKKYSWSEGEDVLFDDTYMHEVWNKSGNRRAVLFCDLLREHSLPGWVQKLNLAMFNLLSKSRRLEKALKKSEVTQDIRQPEMA
ncbi:MAG: aspartyl/asparaginyl beta-hydroxylase domain-containing protein [Bacteroidota bacterium]